MDGMVKRQVIKPPALLWTILRLTGMVGSPLSFSWDFLESVVAFSKQTAIPTPPLFCKPPPWFLGVLAFRNRIEKQPVLCCPSTADGWSWEYCFTQRYFLH